MTTMLLRSLGKLALGVAGLGCAAGGAFAEQAGGVPAIEVAQVGFGGGYRTGSWTPLVVRLGDANAFPDGRVYASVEDPDGQWLTSPPAAVRIGGDGVAFARFCVRLGRPSGRMLVHASPTPPPEQPLALPPPAASTETIVLVCGEVAGIDRAVRLLADEAGSRPRVMVAPNHDLPLAEEPRDLDGADIIVIGGGDALTRDRSTLAAIDGWVRNGGRLVLAAGSSAGRLSAADGPAAGWLPRPVARMVPLRRSAPLEVFAHCTRPMERSLLAGLEVPVFDDAVAIDGAIEAHDGAKPADLPLVVRRSYGLGTITWAGLDLDGPGFRSWTGSDTLLVELLGGQPKSQAGRAGETNRLSLDLAGQLRRSIDRFPGVGAVPFSLVALLGGLSIVLLYPLSWWLVRQTIPGVAWVTLPLLSLTTGGMVWTVGSHWRAIREQTSSAAVVDIDAVSGAARGTAWAGAWSPENTRLDIAAEPATMLGIASPDVAVSWFADAGRGLGATDAPVAHPSLAAADYAYGPTLATLTGVPVAASSSRLFEAEWTGRLTAPPVTASLVLEAQGTLRGTLVHHLPFVLEDCVLAHAGWLYTIGRLPPGEAFDPAAGRGPRSLASALTRRTQNKDRDVVLRWDTAGTDVREILGIAGFHAAAGGSGYTSLESGRLGRLDVSSQLEVGRTVLVGFGPPGTAWSLGGGNASAAAPSSTPTMWRILMRLQTREAEQHP
jgi:hypothetical protein